MTHDTKHLVQAAIIRGLTSAKDAGCRTFADVAPHITGALDHDPQLRI